MRIRIFLAAAAVFALAAVQMSCNLLAIAEAGARQPGALQVTVQPPEESQDPGFEGMPTAYPASPEEVVEQFLSASQDNPALMVQYLTRERQQSLPAEGPQALLGIDAPIEGFMVRSAAVSPDPPAAVIEVDLQAGGEEISRRFDLRQEDGFWFIDQVSGD